jgi:NAD(P)-dependent dehydrogenase (short-subunit alcohol dehydrogenase family)
VLVTGATSGIGQAIARRCAGEGARVLATGRDEERLAELAREPAAIACHAADLHSATGADACVAAAISAFGRLDGLVHSAGIVRRREDIRDTTDQQWAEMISANLDSSFRLARACLRVMVPHGTGSIVLVGSQLAHVASPGYASYCASKGGVEALVRALAVDFGPSGIRVNSLTPGVVATPLAYVDRPDFDDQVEAIAARLPLRRIGQPEDLAGPAVFLLSDDSAWMTGQSLVIDGGFTIQ